MKFNKINLRTLSFSLVIIVCLGIIYFIIQFIKEFPLGEHSYNINEKIEWLSPKTHNIKSQGQNFIYFSTDNTYQFVYPKNWTVKRCAASCDISSSYAFYPDKSNEPVINITTFSSAKWCSTETERLKGVTYWKQVDIKQYYENKMPVTLFEGFVEDSDKKGDTYQQSMKYIQSKDTCYEILSHSKNNPNLFKQSQIVRDSIRILK